MKNRLIVIMAAGVLLLSACSEKKNESPMVKAPDSVQVFSLTKEVVSKTLSLPAELQPWQRAEVYAKVQGYVSDVKVDIGDRVKKNDVLVILDAPEVAANNARSAADLQKAESTYRTSKDIYNRIVKAAKEKGAVSDSERERTRNQMISDSTTYVAAKSSYTTYSQLKDYLVIRAAFDGVITTRNVDQGTLVGAGQTPMLVLENINKLRLQVAIPETYTSAIPASSSISFSVEAQPSKKYSAVLARKSNQIDTRTRTELWEFEVINTDRELMSGMYGNASFNLQRSEPSFVVPYSAVVTNLERSFVIRVNDGKGAWVDVRSGISMKDKIEIFGALAEGDKLVMRANDEIKEGDVIISK